MVRRFISTVALVACAGVYAFATERATFILTDGERKSGTIVYRGGNAENVIAGDLSLGQDNAKDLIFHMDQVAVIDFIGGRPANGEISKVPGSGHYLVMRSGDAQPGTFVNMVGGDTLIWRNESGQEQRYALRDVRLASGPRVPGRPRADRSALLHQLARARVRPRRRVRKRETGPGARSRCIGDRSRLKRCRAGAAPAGPRAAPLRGR